MTRLTVLIAGAMQFASMKLAIGGVVCVAFVVSRAAPAPKVATLGEPPESEQPTSHAQAKIGVQRRV